MNLEFRFYMLHSLALGAICALALAASPAFSSPQEVGKVTAEGTRAAA